MDRVRSSSCSACSRCGTLSLSASSSPSASAVPYRTWSSWSAPTRRSCYTGSLCSVRSGRPRPSFPGWSLTLGDITGAVSVPKLIVHTSVIVRLSTRSVFVAILLRPLRRPTPLRATRIDDEVHRDVGATRREPSSSASTSPPASTASPCRGPGEGDHHGNRRHTLGEVEAADAR